MLKRWLAIGVAAGCVFVPRAVAQAPAGGAVFDRDRLLQIDITLSPADWREVRLTHRDGSDPMLARIAEDGAYTYKPGEISIDGTRVARVGIRKKGLLGSVVSTRPSLKVKFDEYDDGQTFAGLDGLTLNNNNQDQALVQTYLAFDLFARAGVPAPRASFAHVRVNGEDLGIYTNLEPIGKPFLRRVFGSSNGVLYESYAGDFTKETMSRIVEKSGSRNQDRGLPAALRDVLAAPGPLSLARVSQLVDLDSFVRMWAAESLMGHWDSYSANSNNYYLYANPATKKLHFIPWGADSIFDDPGPLLAPGLPRSFKAMGLLSRRLWELPAVRDRYRAVMRKLLTNAWNESRLLNDMAALQKVLQLQSTMLPATVAAASSRIAAFVKDRRGQVETELAAPGPDWPSRAGTLPDMVPVVIEGAFTAPWSVNAPTNPLERGSGKGAVTVAGASTPFDQVAAYAVTFKQGDTTPIALIREKYPSVTMTGRIGARVWQVILVFDPLRLESGPGRHAIDHFDVWAILVAIEGAGPPRLSIFGNVGEVQLDAASARDGGTLAGSFTLRSMLPK